jgi:hypothetical protein
VNERRQKRAEIRHLQSESVWLQKALFALRKAESAREMRADARDEEVSPYVLSLGEASVRVEAIEDALEERAKELIETVRQMRRNLS